MRPSFLLCYRHEHTMEQGYSYLAISKHRAFCRCICSRLLAGYGVRAQRYHKCREGINGGVPLGALPVRIPQLVQEG